VLPVRETLEVEILVDRWLFARARAGLPSQLSLAATFDELRNLEPAALARSRSRLAAFFAALPDSASLPEPLRDELSAVAAELFALERAWLRAVTDEQRLINDRLLRPQGRALVGGDFGPQVRRAGPFLEQVLAQGLGLSITVRPDSATLSSGPHGISLAD
jgi:hypothetical protein